MSTTIPSGKDIKRKWFVLERQRQNAGRLDTQAASILAGKLNVLYTPISYGRSRHHHQCLKKIVLTGLKSDQKLYRRTPASRRSPRRVLHQTLAVAPKPSSSRPSRACCQSPSSAVKMATKLKVYKGAQHPATSPAARCHGLPCLPTRPRWLTSKSGANSPGPALEEASRRVWIALRSIFFSGRC